MPQCYIALGGNTGNVAQTFRLCLKQLADHPAITMGCVSSFLSTSPVGENAGRQFLNAAAELHTELSPIALLDLLQNVENTHGRRRDLRWGPRTLDLDLLFYGNSIIDTPRLTLPHPACWYRRFVLDPLAEIAVDFQHPVKQISIGKLHSRLQRRPFSFACVGGNPERRQAVLDALNSVFPQVKFHNDGDEAQISDDTSGPTIIAWLGGDRRTFEQLPIIPRLDATSLEGDVAEALESVLHSALGE